MLPDIVTVKTFTETVTLEEKSCFKLLEEYFLFIEYFYPSWVLYTSSSSIALLFCGSEVYKF